MALTYVPGPILVCVTVGGAPFIDVAVTLILPGESVSGDVTGAIADADGMIPLILPSGGAGGGKACAIADADAMTPTPATMR